MTRAEPAPAGASAGAPLLAALNTADAVGAIRRLDEDGQLTQIIPELKAGRGFVQPELHYYDVLDHNLAAVAALDAALGDGADGRELRETLAWTDVEGALARAIDGLPVVALTRLACLVHDVAKPATATMVEGRLRFPRHGPRGAELMAARLPLIGLGAEATAFVTTMVRYHLRPGELVRNWPASDRALRKFVADVGGEVLPLMLVNLADGMATRGPRYTRENYRRHCGFVNYVVARAWAVSGEGEPPLIGGEELMAELDLEGGRLLGAVLTSVREAQLAGSVTGRDEALAMARRVFADLRANAG